VPFGTGPSGTQASGGATPAGHDPAEDAHEVCLTRVMGVGELYRSGEYNQLKEKRLDRKSRPFSLTVPWRFFSAFGNICLFANFIEILVDYEESGIITKWNSLYETNEKGKKTEWKIRGWKWTDTTTVMDIIIPKYHEFLKYLIDC
jgi:hypothetical protein